MRPTADKFQYRACTGGSSFLRVWLCAPVCRVRSLQCMEVHTALRDISVGQNETAAPSAGIHLVSYSPSFRLESSPTAEAPGLPSPGGPLLMVAALSVLSVLCVCVLVTVVVVIVVRVRRGLRRWRQTSHTPEKTRQRTSGNGATAHLLSSALSNQNFEWCRPRSLSPSSPVLSSSPRSTLHCTLPTHLPSSPTSTHNYSEIRSLSPNQATVVHPTPSSPRPHFYDEVECEDPVKSETLVGSGEWAKTEQVHLYSLLEDPTEHSPPSLASNQHSLANSGGPQTHNPESRESSPMSRCSSVSVQDSNPDWVLSPVARFRPSQPPRRVVPYRVSLILPLWEGRERGGPALPLPAQLAGRHPTFTTSCQGLEESGRYNHLEGVTVGYGSLEENAVYATLEPFVGPDTMRLRSSSCDARLYNHLQH